MQAPRRMLGALLAVLSLACAAGAEDEPRMSDERMVFQTRFGDLEMGFYPDVAPETVAHILEVAKLGGYNTNHFFRVDKGFVAQVADVIGGRTTPLNEHQSRVGALTVPGEFSKVKHKRGILSMGRYDDPNSATSSFSILLGDAPHLDEKYCVFGKLTAGWDVLSKMEEVETRREGIFVMPKERIDISSTYVYSVLDDKGSSHKSLDECEERNKALQVELHEKRIKKLPSA